MSFTLKHIFTQQKVMLFDGLVYLLLICRGFVTQHLESIVFG
jgi:hypothetical protein